MEKERTFQPVESEVKNTDFSLVEVRELWGRKYPFCKLHGAMNKVSPTLWRCIGQYSKGPEIITDKGKRRPGNFTENTCKAACKEEND